MNDEMDISGQLSIPMKRREGSDEETVVAQREEARDVPQRRHLSEKDIDAAILDTLRSSQEPLDLRRVDVGDMTEVDEQTMTSLQASPTRKFWVPHVKRIVEEERVRTRSKANFVARSFKQQPGVVYAVRYWTGLATIQAIKAALKEVREAWTSCQPSHPHAQAYHNEPQNQKCKDGDRGPVVSAREEHHASETAGIKLPRDGQELPESPVVGALSPEFPASKGKTSSFITATPTTSESALVVSKGESAGGEAQSEGAGSSATSRTDRTTLLGDNSEGGRATTGRNSLLRVLGFSVEVEHQSGDACVTLISEWPGMGSIHDLLIGKATGVQGSTQRDLLRWTRQAAEDLVIACSCSGGGIGGRVVGTRSPFRISSRNAYLFRRPMDSFQSDGAEVLDIRVATFLGGRWTWNGDSATDTSCRGIMPPEMLRDSPSPHVGVPASNEAETRHYRGFAADEAADVWGMGTFVFELAIGRSAGPIPLALRPVADLVRAIPIGPRFIYGDISRGVVRVALRNRPEDRVRAVQLAATVEDIAARTLSRAYMRKDRYARLVRKQPQAAEQARAKNEVDTPEEDLTTAPEGRAEDDGYSQAVAQWKIQEAAERAGGRARAFLRQLWFDSLSKDGKRRVKHRRRHRKANREMREWRARRVKAAAIGHWTPGQVAHWVSHLLKKAEASRRLPLLFSGDAKGGLFRMGNGGDDHMTNKKNKEKKRDTSSSGCVQYASPTLLTSTPTAPRDGFDNHDCGGGEREGERGEMGVEVRVPEMVSNRETTIDSTNHSPADFRDAEGNEAGEVDAHGDDDDDEHDNNDSHDSEDGGSGDSKSSWAGGNVADDNGWGSVEDAERTGYAGVAVEPFAVAKRVDGTCVLEAMGDAMSSADDALTRFIKSSIKLRRPDEIEKKRVQLMVRELLTVRPYSTPTQLKVRGLLVAIVHSAEAPRKLAEEQVDSQLPSLAIILITGYRHQVFMATQGKPLAAARIQGLFRGRRTRLIVTSIWKEAEEYARNIIQGEREAKLKKEAEQRTKEKADALRRERERAERYRLRLVPRTSMVTCRSMNVSLPPFLVAAANGIPRFVVAEYTFAPPSPLLLPINTPMGQPRRVDLADEVRDVNDCSASRSNGKRSKDGAIRVTLRQGSTAEREALLDHRPSSLLPSTTSSAVAREGAGEVLHGFGSKKNGGCTDEYQTLRGAASFVRAAGGVLALSGLQPCTKYHLTLEMPPLVREDLLKTARSNGLTEAICALEGPAKMQAERDETVGGGPTRDHIGASISASEMHSKDYGSNISSSIDARRGGDVGGNHTSPPPSLEVETLPDVPEEPRVVCKVLTSASAADPRDPHGVVSLREWQSPYPGIADMDSSVGGDYLVIAPGRPEPIVSLQWSTPATNGLKISSYIVERRIGCAGVWTKISCREGVTTGELNDRLRREGRERQSHDAVDAPLRTIPVTTLRKVAVQTLSLSYRVHAANALGAGPPSALVEVDIQAFLGRLRLKDTSGASNGVPVEIDAATAYQGQSSLVSRGRNSLQSPTFSSRENHAPNPEPDFSSPYAATGTGAAATDISIAAVNAAYTSKFTPKALRLRLQEPPKPGKDHRKPSPAEKARPEGVKGDKASISTPYSQSALGDDFMGLDGYGEARVHCLFAPPSSRDARQRRNRAPAEEPATSYQHLPCGSGSIEGRCSLDNDDRYPLPPVVITSGISSAEGILQGRDGAARRGGLQPVPYGCGSTGSDAKFKGDWKGGSGDVRASRGNECESHNGVYHVFLNLGRRLPGRLHRDF